MSTPVPRRRGRRAAEAGGRLAETLACWWLRLKGYRILERRLRTPVGEIDILAGRGSVVAVVEVKARRDTVQAAEAIGPAQWRRLARAAAWLLAHRPDLAGRSLRFDAVLIAPAALPRHVADAWRPSANHLDYSRG